MSDFKAKMHQTPLGELTALPRSLAAFKGATSRGRQGKEKKGEGKGFEVPPALLIPPPRM